MQENGLLLKWKEISNPKTAECLLKKYLKNKGKPQISVKNLTSVFILLILGICISLIVYFLELICHVRSFNYFC